VADEYEVGYGKPPQEARFLKGKSGNPKGRPKGAQSLVARFAKHANKKVVVKENGKTKTVTKVEAVFLQVLNRAMSGDPAAVKLVLSWCQQFEHVEKSSGISRPDMEKDRSVMRRLMARMASIKVAEENPTAPSTDESANDKEKNSASTNQ
jgi:hypothetical protein